MRPMQGSPNQPTVATHWGTYTVRERDGRRVLEPHAADPDPSPIAHGMLEAQESPARILRPAVRRSFLAAGGHAGGEGRGREPFVQVSWEEATALVAGELARVIDQHGNEAIYGGSYGWASAGRFHHAQSQIHRFLNCIGGYTRSVGSYSFAAAEVVVPHVVGDAHGVVSGHTSWPVVAEHSTLVVAFGGLPAKNAQVDSGGLGRHTLRGALAACRERGVRILSVSPIADDVPDAAAPEWLPIRPNTDVALMLGLAHTLRAEALHDRAFLERFTVGHEQVFAYLDGEPDGVVKDAAWAAEITAIPAERIRALARAMAANRTLIAVAWSLQRADHGEQPYWAAITLAAMLGQIGLPGGGFGFGYAAENGIGAQAHGAAWPSLPQGHNAVSQYIPVARIADMLLHPGSAYAYNGSERTYPDIRAVYWAGGNPFHHHQDLNRLVRAFRRPEVVVVHDSWWTATARHADVVLPVATQLERNDVCCSRRDTFISASHQLAPPAGEARTDFAIFGALAAELGVEREFTAGRDEEGWLRHLYGRARERLPELPPFEDFWEQGAVFGAGGSAGVVLLDAFRADPDAHPLATPSGRVELYSETVAGFGYDDCPGHASWLEPREWQGGPAADRHPLHLLSNQPATRLHSQYDHAAWSRQHKVADREPVRIHPADARDRGIADGDVVRIFNDRGACLAGAVVSAAVRPGVLQLSTGAWYDPLDPDRDGSLDKHGNPNVLTTDRPTSRLAQGPAANSCLVEVERHDGPLPPLTCFTPPAFVGAPA